MRQKRVWLSNKEYHKKKRWEKKVQAIVEAQQIAEEQQEDEEELRRKEFQKQHGILPPTPSLGNYIWGTGDRTKGNPTGQLGVLPYLLFLVVGGVLYKLSFGILPLILVILLACGVGIWRWIKQPRSKSNGR